MSRHHPLNDQVVLITGASSGIGAAAARAFAREGCTLVLAARRLDRLEALQQELAEAGTQSLVVQTDVSRLADLQKMVSTALGRFQRIDILINNAGFGRLDWLENLDPEEDIQAMLDVNLAGTILATRLVLPHMLNQHSGHILNVASIASWIPTPTYSIYAATKYGLRGFTDALRREVRREGIYVTGVYPGAVETEFANHIGGPRQGKMRSPAWTRLSADQVANALVRAVDKRQRTLIMPWFYYPAVAVHSVFPGPVDWLMGKIFSKRKNEFTSEE